MCTSGSGSSTGTIQSIFDTWMNASPKRARHVRIHLRDDQFGRLRRSLRDAHLHAERAKPCSSGGLTWMSAISIGSVPFRKSLRNLPRNTGRESRPVLR